MKYINKDITTVTGPALIMHGVNCQQAMGSGVAKALYEKWPEVREQYMKIPKDFMELGKVQWVEVDKDLHVINCFTQEYFGSDGTVYASSAAIRECLGWIGYVGLEYDIFNLYAPKIGCGLGGLDWEKDVLPEFEWFEDKHPEFNVTICEIGE